MKKLLISLSVLMIAGFSLSSCLKEAKVQDPGFNVAETGNNATALLEIPLDVYQQADRAIRFQYDSIKSKNKNQASFTFKMGYISLTVSPADTTTYPKTITLDFGTDAANLYQGQMSMIVSGDMRNDRSTCAITYHGLVCSGSSITGTDSIISQGKNSSGSILSHFVMHGGQLKGYNNESVSYTGAIFGKFNVASGVKVLDTVEINATDANLNVYRLYSDPKYMLQMNKGCNYFSSGVISADIKVKGVLTGNLGYDYGYNSLQDGTINPCDAGGVVYITSKVNSNFNQTSAFYAMGFK